MNVGFSCYSCIFKMLLELTAQIKIDNEKKIFINKMLKVLIESDNLTSPPELAEKFFELFGKEIGVNDFFIEEKKISTEIGLKLLPILSQEAINSSNPFHTKVIFAIGGNIIDYGTNPDFDLSKAEEQIRNVLNYKYDYQMVNKLQKCMANAKKILYILDNCGEAVLDRLLIEDFKDKITIGVRGKPILNDVTTKDAIASGLINYPIVDTGCAIPGVALRRVSPDFLKKINESDLIIAKGQGNFESLENNIKKPCFFLFRAKCDTIAKYIGTELGSVQIISRNI